MVLWHVSCEFNHKKKPNNYNNTIILKNALDVQKLPKIWTNIVKKTLNTFIAKIQKMQIKLKYSDPRSVKQVFS